MTVLSQRKTRNIEEGTRGCRRRRPRRRPHRELLQQRYEHIVHDINVLDVDLRGRRRRAARTSCSSSPTTCRGISSTRSSRPHIVALQHRGETFSNYFVADSLCCPSRSTIFTGLFPHDTKVVANVGPDGGFQKFQSEGLDKKTFAVALHQDGYSTSMLGKYLNGYGDPKMTPRPRPSRPAGPTGT